MASFVLIGCGGGSSSSSSSDTNTTTENSENTSVNTSTTEIPDDVTCTYLVQNNNTLPTTGEYSTLDFFAIDNSDNAYTTYYLNEESDDDGNATSYRKVSHVDQNINILYYDNDDIYYESIGEEQNVNTSETNLTITDTTLHLFQVDTEDGKDNASCIETDLTKYFSVGSIFSSNVLSSSYTYNNVTIDKIGYEECVIENVVNNISFDYGYSYSGEIAIMKCTATTGSVTVTANSEEYESEAETYRSYFDMDATEVTYTYFQKGVGIIAEIDEDCEIDYNGVTSIRDMEGCTPTDGEYVFYVGQRE